MSKSVSNDGDRPGGVALLAGRPVGRIGYGTLQLSGPGGRALPAMDTALEVLRRAYQLGVNHFDTAHFYRAGLANALLRAALEPYPDDVVIVTKVGAEEDAQGKLTAAQRPEELRAAVDANLSSLGVERLDVVNLRRLDGPPGIVAQGDQRVDLDSQLTALASLRDEGKIGSIGLSNVSLAQLGKATPLGIACVQNSYSLIERSSEPLLAFCSQHDIAWVPFFPLGSAFPGRPKVADHPAVVTAAARLNATPSQIGLRWLLAHDAHILLIPGTTTVAHLEENIAASRVQLDPQTIAELDSAAMPAS
jgi:pyridoxine 4-dehydrogenase